MDKIVINRIESEGCSGCMFECLVSDFGTLECTAPQDVFDCGDSYIFVECVE